jgi:hypothetical protein
MPVISWWYPHRFDGSMVPAFDRVAFDRVFRSGWWQYGASDLVRGDFTSERL